MPILYRLAKKLVDHFPAQVVVSEHLFHDNLKTAVRFARPSPDASKSILPLILGSNELADFRLE